MIKAEVIAHEGYEVPNWVARCKDVLFNGPAIAVLTIAVVAGFGILVWRGHQPAYTDQSTAQSQPANNSSLQVLSADNLPVQASSASIGAVDTTTSIGPASASSLSQLQSTGLTQNNVSGLNQAGVQGVQSAGKATNTQLQNLGL